MKKKFIVLSLLFLASFCFAKEVKINGDVEVRDRPSENGTVFASLADGTSVDVESISENSDWYEIKIDDATGYIHKSSLASVFSISYIKNSIVPFKGGLFWWIVIDKLILIGFLLYFIFSHKIGSVILWILACLGSTSLLAFIFSLIGTATFIEALKYTALLFLGAAPFILAIVILFVLAAATDKSYTEKYGKKS